VGLIVACRAETCQNPESGVPVPGGVGRLCWRRTTVAKTQRTTHRSATGKKLYAVRDSKGRFKDIQTYERAHGADVKRKSKKEK
jgi:hypothetical protein